jgi:hypothetical protein
MRWKESPPEEVTQNGSRMKKGSILIIRHDEAAIDCQESNRKPPMLNAVVS